ncbi:MAG TPA: ABC transporter ATP-binding protein [Candidatus Hydrogenedentes bacterium]|nr:ABC transporter ATP-binding protein [Candidatus Hydrogenedentota bacterium]
MPLLTVKNLRTYFHTRNGIVRAVDKVSFSMEPGETLGIVGESGSGKSVTMYSLLGLIPSPPGRIEEGVALFDGEDLLTASKNTLRSLRGKRIAMIFQDPMTALNPYMRIGAQVMEPLLVHEGCSRNEARRRAAEVLTQVGIQDAAARMDRYPHEFSGGMRQRVMIAMALITHPDLLIADEPTTALDVTVQAQVLELIRERQRDLGMAMILVTHNLGVVAGACKHVLVMYAGRVLESGPVHDIFHDPRHPYTRALMQSMPSLSDTSDTLFTIPGQPPDLSASFTGCPFAPRCHLAKDYCSDIPCTLEEVWPGHATACVRTLRNEL